MRYTHAHSSTCESALMEIDARGRIANIVLRPKEVLLPLYEALVNSIDAIREANREDGRIEIQIMRPAGVQSLYEADKGRQELPIIGFEVSDNGIGFTDPNFQAFNTSDTTKKRELGGKGVGRLLWLKAFEKVTVESLFHQEETCCQRRFEFSEVFQGLIDNHKLIKGYESSEAGSGKLKTVVRLLNPKPDYQKELPKRTDVLGRRIIEYALQFFVLQQMPTVVLCDEATETVLELNREFLKWKTEEGQVAFEIEGHNFTMQNFLLEAQSGLSHKLSFCADKRVVRAEGLGSRIPDLLGRIRHTQFGERPVVYSGYVSGTYLDESVNQSRTEFSGIPSEAMEGLPSWNTIVERSVNRSQHYLKPFLEPTRISKERQIEEYIMYEAPQYRPLLKFNRELLDCIPAGLSNEKLDEELYRLQGQAEKESRRKFDEVLESYVAKADDAGVDTAKYTSYLEEWNVRGKANLAKYIVHRKLVIELLEKVIGIGPTGKFAPEKAVHEIVFPLRKTSDDLSYEEHNLWILDEKLAYHYYLASDKQLNQIPLLESEDRDRPDLVIFERPIAIVEGESPYSSVVLFEFKRPMREEFGKEEDPITQVYGYIDDIQAGTAKSRRGRSIPIASNAPFFCYIVCDLTEKIHKFAKGAGLLERADRQGFYGWNTPYKAYVELISFDKLLSDAKKRNRILFEKLGIGNRAQTP